MTDYTKTTDFTSKDSLPSGDSGKIIRGAEFGTEFDNIETAVNSKSNIENPSFTGNITVTGTVDGRDIAADGTKLDTIETSADVTDTANVTAAGAVMDSELTNIAAVKALNQGVATTDSPTFAAVTSTGNVTVGGTVDGRDVAADGTKLDGIEAGATADQTAAQIKTAYESNANTNAFTDADHTKLDGIEASADVTDTTNVTAAGALMDSELTDIAAVKALNQGVATTDSPTFAGATVNGTVEFDGLSGTGAVTVTNILDQDNMSSNSATALATQQSIKAYVDSQVATSDTLAEVLANGNTTGGTDVAFGDNDKAIFGTGSDLQIFHDGSNSFISDQGSGSLVLRGSTAINLQNGAGTEYLARFFENGSANLYYDAAQKLATTSTGIAVTGSVVSDGLTVDGASAGTVTAATFTNTTNANGTRVQAVLQNVSSVCNVNLVSERVGANFGADFIVETSDTVDGTDRQRLRVAETGDISFYEDTGTTAKFFWDASAERLGLGTTTPSTALHIQSSDSIIKLEGTTSARLQFMESDTTDKNFDLVLNNGSFLLNEVTDVGGFVSTPFKIEGGAGSNTLVLNASGHVGIGTSSPDRTLHVEGAATFETTTGNGALLVLANDSVNRIYSRAGNQSTTALPLAFNQGSAEAMRIDSNRNLLVSTTDTSPVGNNVAGGIALLNNGSGQFSRDGGTALLLNRKSSDGEFLRFNKDGSIVGSIGTYSGDMIIGLGDHKLRFFDSSSAISPCVDNGTVNDNTIDLGVSNSRFKDLYLSGNIHADAQIFATGIGHKSDTNTFISFPQSDRIVFTTGNDEAMRIDSNQNVLVGKTSTGITTEGIEARADGLLSATRDGNTVGFFNRLTSDGTIIDVRKDGSTVGSIGTSGGSTYIGGYLNGGLYFNGTSDVRPWNTSTQANLDNSVDLGNSSARFKDLYLSGGAYLGGTAAGNKLDDYEEGTWTPVLTREGATSNATITLSGTSTYTKVGRVVTLTFYASAIDFSGVTDGGNAVITGLPFGCVNWTSGSIGYGAATNASSTTWVVNGTKGYFLQTSNNGFRNGTVDLNRGMFSVVYQTV